MKKISKTKQEEEFSKEDIVNLIVFPNTIDNIRSFEQNIKAYGYLENMSGFFQAIVGKDNFKEACHSI